MDVDFVFRIAGIGILVTVIGQVLTRAGREDIALLAGVAGILTALLTVISLAGDVLAQARAIFHLS